MAIVSVAIEAFKGCFQNWRLWLIQFAANLALFGFFTLWLFIPVSNIWYIALNSIVVLLFLALTLVLHGGTLSYFSAQTQDNSITLLKTFRNTARNLPAIFIAAAILGLAWYLAGSLDRYEDSLPNYLRSNSPLFIRKVVLLPTYQALVNGGLFTLQWILVPSLFLPLLASSSSKGFRGLGAQGFASWKSCVAKIAYWAVIAAAVVLGVYATGKIMNWTPDFRTSTLRHETASLIWRGLISYLLALFAWIFSCSMVGRCSGATADARDDIARQTAA